MMRKDQLERLQDLQDNLLETVLVDADPSLWAGSGKAPQDMTQEERGDAYWCRKVAMSSVSLLTKVTGLITVHTAPSEGDSKDDGDMDKEIARAEREAARLMDKALAQARG